MQLLLTKARGIINIDKIAYKIYLKMKSKKSPKYFFLDLNITNMTISNWGVSDTATLTGDTEDPNVHRIFLTEGQYNKLLKKLG